MLRINTFTSAEGAVDYFNESLAGDYFSEDEVTIGIWGGKGAERLGLDGQVGRKEFQALVNNRDREGNRLRPGWKREGRSGFDFTFDVPKSVSILYELTEDERIREAFEAASVETMAELERDAAVRVRRGGANYDRQTGELTWSRFTHHTSRPVEGVSDPHLHAHFFVHNLSWDEAAGGFRALQAGDIKASAYYYEAMHHSKVAAKLERIGFKIERRGKAWEIANAPKGLIAKFSRRKAEIEAEIARKGIVSDTLKSEVGARCRSRKEKATLSELRRGWEAKLTDQEREWLAEAGNGGTSSWTPESRSRAADQAIVFASRDWFANHSLVAERRFLASALQHAVGKADLSDITAALERNGIKTKQANGARYFTTDQVEREERYMLEFARVGQGFDRAFVREQHRFRRDFLNVGQRAAVEHVLYSTDRVTAIRGAAGTGKTTLMQEAIEAMEKRGHRVRTFAPSSDASRLTLRKEGFEDAETLAMLLASERVQESVRGGVIWVDEAGMVGTRDMARLFDLSKQLNARIVLSGDFKQHSAVQRGDALRLLVEQEAVRSREVTEILRQRGEYRRAIEELSQGRVGEGFEILDDLQAIREIENDDERSAKVADDYVTLLGQGRNALVVSPTHREAGQVTDQIRERLREQGDLQGEEKSVYRQVNRYWGEGTKSESESYQGGEILQFVKPAPGFQIGDRVEIQRDEDSDIIGYQFLDGQRANAPLPLDKPDRFQVYSQTEIGLAAGDRIRITQGGTLPNRYRLENGSMHEVKQVTDEGEVKLSNGVVLPKHWGNFNYAYVATSYSSQGKTVDEVLISQSADSFPASSREQFYVSSSRGRENVRIYTDSKLELLEAVGVSQERLAAIEAAPVEKPSPQKPEQPHGHPQETATPTQYRSETQAPSAPSAKPNPSRSTELPRKPPPVPPPPPPKAPPQPPPPPPPQMGR